MHGNMNVKFVNAKHAKEIYQYRNTREKLYKTYAAIWYKNLHETYQCRMYFRKLLMMGREDARNMYSFITE
jgi:hypothetical protein